jgi:hypothetical protein
LAGLGGVAIIGHQGESDQTVPAVSSITGSDTATATAAAGGRRARSVRASLQANPLDTSRHREYQWPDVTIELNTTAIGQRVANRMRQGEARHTAWAAELDRGVSYGLLAAAWTKVRDDFRASSIPEVGFTSLYADWAVRSVVDMNPQGIAAAATLYGACVAIGAAS